MKKFFSFVIGMQRWVSFLFLSFLLFIILLIMLVFVSMLISAPANAYLPIDRIRAIWLFIISLVGILPGAIAGIYYWRSYYRALGQLSAAALSIRLYPEEFGEIDYTLVTRLFQDCQEVRLYPLPGGFSGSLVFNVDSQDLQRMRQRPMILKLGPRRKIEAEEQNYHTFVEPYIGNTVIFKGAEYERDRGAILFTYASISRGKALTFEEFYSDVERKTADNVVAVIEELFQNALQPWLEGAQPNPHSRLYQTYNLAEDWEEIRQTVRDLGFTLGADYFDCLRRRVPNPLKEAQEWFKVRRDWESVTRDTIVHGDLNSRNILIDSNRNVFVIDFARTEWSHLLRDFCKLEAEIKFCLTRLHCDDDIEQAIALEERLLLAANGEPFTDLESLLNINEVENTDKRLERARRSVIALRRIASRSMGLQVTGPAKQYYLSLLHYTLDAVRYEQCDRNSKLYALISASLLCRALR